MKKAMFKKVANSFTGRMLRRLMGEEKGSVMIEYILVALLIVVAGIVVFSMLGGVLGGTGEAVATGITNGSNAEVQADLQKVDEYVTKKKEESKTRVGNVNRDKDTAKW